MFKKVLASNCIISKLPDGCDVTTNPDGSCTIIVPCEIADKWFSYKLTIIQLTDLDGLVVEPLNTDYPLILDPISGNVDEAGYYDF